MKDIKCFVLDMDGTIYLGDELFSYTKDFLKKAEALGLDIWFYTNNSSKNPEFYIEKLKKMGIDWPLEKMLISNQVIIKYLLDNHKDSKVYLSGTSYLQEDFEKAGINLSDKDCDVVVMGFDTTLTYEKLVIASDFVRYGAKFYGVNMDYNCPTETGFIPDCGSICKLIEASTGVAAEFFGKPSSHTANYILDRTGYSKDQIAIVGDRLYTDIALGVNNGIKSFLVMSGEAKEEDLKTSEFKPDYIFKNLEELGKALEDLDR